MPATHSYWVMTMPDDYSPERLADRWAIQDVLGRWVRALDRRDFAAAAELFHSDAKIVHSGHVGQVPPLLSAMQERHRDIVHAQHLLSPSLIEFAGPDSAIVETNIFATLRIRAGAASAVAVGGDIPDYVGRSAVDSFSEGRYIDRFERRDGVWKIAARTTASDWIRLAEVPDGAFTARPEWQTGSRDRNDPIYTERAALGIAD